MAIIRVAGESILIGVTDSHISMIKSLSLIDDEVPSEVPQKFAEVMSSDDVSKVHACILCVVETDQDIKVKETDKLSGAWYTEDEITTGIFDKFENWSKIAYSKLFGRKEPKAAKKEKIIAVNNVKNVMNEKKGK